MERKKEENKVYKIVNYSGTYFFPNMFFTFIYLMICYWKFRGKEDKEKVKKRWKTNLNLINYF